MSAIWVKRARTPSEVEDLRREARILDKAAHPGVPEVVLHHFSLDYGELHLARVVGLSIADTAFLDTAQLAEAFTSLATTVAHLHDRGVVHRSIDSEHVIMAALDGRPVLCGFGAARDTEEGAALERAEDVSAVGRLLQSKLGAPVAALRERLASEDPKSRATDMHRALTEIANAATSADPDRRPTARRLASLLRAASLGEKPAEPAPPPAPRHRRELPNVNGRLIVFCLVVVAIVTLVAVTIMHFIERSTADDQSSCPTYSGEGTQVDVDGDGCTDLVQLGSGTVTINDELFTVGEDGDVLAIGRWNCDERPRTLALLRPSDGKVYVFDSWPEAGGEMAPREVGEVEDGLTIAPLLQPNGCDAIDVATLNNEHVELIP